MQRAIRLCRITVTNVDSAGVLSQLQIGSHAILIKLYLAGCKRRPVPQFCCAHLSRTEVRIECGRGPSVLEVVVEVAVPSWVASTSFGLHWRRTPTAPTGD